MLMPVFMVMLIVLFIIVLNILTVNIIINTTNVIFLLNN